MKLVRVLVVLVVVGSVLAPSSGVGADGVVAQSVDGLCDVAGVEQFFDVGVGDYGAAYILCMRALGLSQGRNDGGYGPDRELNRGQMASFLIRLWTDHLGGQCPSGVLSPFTDTEGNTHEANIDCLFGLGITQGTSATTYSPRDPLKASQISRFLFRAYEKTGGRCDGEGGELVRALECLLGLGVIPSKAEGAGGGSVSRAQMAVYVIGLWHNVTGGGVAPPPPGKPVADGSEEDQDGEAVTVPVRVDRVELDHVDPAEVGVSLGLSEPVGVGEALSGEAEATGLALAVDGEDRVQGLSLVVKGDTSVDVHVSYKTTAAALVLQTPGFATTDPVVTWALVALLSGLDEAQVLAEQLEADATRYGSSYLVDLSPDAQQALSETVAALGRAVEELAAESAVGDSGRLADAGHVRVGGSVAGVGLAADPERSAVELPGAGVTAVVRGDCEPVWHPDDGSFGTWDPLDEEVRRDDGVCFEGSVGSLSGENEAWTALVVPVTQTDDGAVRFGDSGELYLPSKFVDIPSLFGDVLWGFAKNSLCVGASIPLEVVEWASFGWLGNPLHCDWESYAQVFRVNSGGTIENVDLRPLYEDDDPPMRLAVVKSHFAGNNPYQDRLPVANPATLTLLQDQATIYQAVHLLTPALGLIVGKGLKKVSEHLKEELDTHIGDGLFLSASNFAAAEFSAVLTRSVVDALLDKEDFVDVISGRRGQTRGEKEAILRTLVSLILPTLESVLKSAVKKVAVGSVPVIGQIITAIDTGIQYGNVGGTWFEALFRRSYDRLSFYSDGAPIRQTSTSPTEPPDGTFKAIAAGGHVTCGLRTNGTIQCWGQNINDQATPPTGTYTAITNGGEHGCAIATDGTTACWGNNQYTQSDPPTKRLAAVEAGGNFTCGLDDRGSVDCWGGDTHGETQHEPQGTHTAIAAGLFHACALTTDRTINCWGLNDSGQASPPTGTYTAVSAGFLHSCAIRTDQTITCWGRDDNYWGQNTPPTGTYTAIEASDNHTCAIHTSGRIHCWGENVFGQSAPPSGAYTAVTTGHAHTCAINTDRTIDCWRNQQSPPASLPVLSAGEDSVCAIRTDQTLACWGRDPRLWNPAQGTFAAVSVGGYHACGLQANGGIACWGDHLNGRASPPRGTFTAVSSGQGHSCAIRTDRSLACWGSNAGGKARPPSGTFTAVAAGDYHSCGIRTDSTITCWGYNKRGQLDAPSGAFIAVAAGELHACAIRINQTIECWGKNDQGQADPPDGTFTAVTTADDHSCGLRTDGTIACWGFNGNMEADPPDGTFIAVAAARSHTCGITTGGTIECWGSMTGTRPPPDGRFGPPDNSASSEPDTDEADQPRGSADPFTQVLSAGRVYSCAIRADQTILCWGGNGPTRTNRGLLHAPSGTFTQVSTGNVATCALRTDQTILCWNSTSLTAPSGTYTQVSNSSIGACALSTAGTIVCWGGYAERRPTGSFVHVSGGSTHSCAIRTDGTVACWGLYRSWETEAPSGTFTQVSAGGHVSCGIRTDKSIVCWGRTVGQIDAPAGAFAQVSTGLSHSCAVRTDGTLVCWGNDNRELTEAPSGTFAQVVVGDVHSCAKRTDGRIVCWGINTHGQATAPAGAFAHLSAAHGYSCAIRNDGSLTCWHGMDRATVVEPVPAGSFTQVSSSGGHACALRTDKTAVCWGGNLAGQTDAPSDTFTQISTGSDRSCGIRTDRTVVCWGDTRLA